MTLEIFGTTVTSPDINLIISIMIFGLLAYRQFITKTTIEGIEKQFNMASKVNKKEIILSLMLILLISCREDEKIGICASADGKICNKAFTKDQCDIYNRNKEAGKDWVFYEGSSSICPPISPTGP